MVIHGGITGEDEGAGKHVVAAGRGIPVGECAIGESDAMRRAEARARPSQSPSVAERDPFRPAASDAAVRPEAA